MRHSLLQSNWSHILRFPFGPTISPICVVCLQVKHFLTLHGTVPGDGCWVRGAIDDSCARTRMSRRFGGLLYAAIGGRGKSFPNSSSGDIVSLKSFRTAFIVDFADSPYVITKGMTSDVGARLVKRASVLGTFETLFSAN